MRIDPQCLRATSPNAQAAAPTPEPPVPAPQAIPEAVDLAALRAQIEAEVKARLAAERQAEAAPQAPEPEPKRTPRRGILKSFDGLAVVAGEYKGDEMLGIYETDAQGKIKKARDGNEYALKGHYHGLGWWREHREAILALLDLVDEEA